jgi:hypothetical protein
VDQLWQAALGYMRRALPLSAINSGSRTIETPVLEWTIDDVPHRTQITVSIKKASGNLSDLSVVALDIAPAAALEDIYTGRAIDFAWELRGNLPAVEVVILDQIKARFSMIIEGRSADLVPLVAPLPGLRGSPANVTGPYFRPGSSGTVPSRGK